MREGRPPLLLKQNSRCLKFYQMFTHGYNGGNFGNLGLASCLLALPEWHPILILTLHRKKTGRICLLYVKGTKSWAPKVSPRERERERGGLSFPFFFFSFFCCCFGVPTSLTISRLSWCFQIVTWSIRRCRLRSVVCGQKLMPFLSGVKWC
jgi:hypothetical protein